LVLDEQKKDDEIIVVNDIEIIVSSRDKGYVGNSKIDYIDDYRGKGLTIHSVSGDCC